VIDATPHALQGQMILKLFQIHVIQSDLGTSILGCFLFQLKGVAATDSFLQHIIAAIAMLSPLRIATRQSGLRAYQLRTSVRAASAWAKVAQGPPVSAGALST